MNEVQRRAAAKKFVENWKDRGSERSDAQSFWLALLRDVLGVESPENYVAFEENVRLKNASFIDGYIEATRVLIEQKSRSCNLDQKIKQSDGTSLTPFEQAKRYAAELPYSRRPRWIVVCNFEKFHIYDRERPTEPRTEIRLQDLAQEAYRLRFLVDSANERVSQEIVVSVQAGALVGKLYDALLKKYNDPTNPRSLRALNVLCVRLVFCLYAEDAGVFPERNQFCNYLKRFDPKDFRDALIKLFRVLDQKEEERDPYLDDEIAAFPYVNGGLFADETLEIPKFDEEIVRTLLDDAGENFDWSPISPTIFGAVFESTLNPETRRSGGMHYTSIDNIRKVIGPLFLDDLRRELDAIKGAKIGRGQNSFAAIGKRNAALHDFRRKIGKLRFFDPACGSGNFLTETYLSLRRLENEALRTILDGQKFLLSVDDLIQVKIDNFYGIEINDFAATVAKTALWIAESQTMKETEDVARTELDFLPLKTNANIVAGNALRIDWESVVPKEELSYILGNPPFVGFTYTSAEQKADFATIFPKCKFLDYVTAWYVLAAKYIQGTGIEVAFVSTNSICQGEAVAPLWNRLFDEFGVKINFAHQTFQWSSEARGNAAVMCVIVGFSLHDREQKALYLYENVKAEPRFLPAKTINAYLVDGPNAIVQARSKPLGDVPPIGMGSKATDDRNFTVKDDEKEAFLKAEPAAERFLRPFVGSEEFINNKKRWCLWLADCPPNELRNMPLVMERVEKVRRFREASSDRKTRQDAATPTLFQQRHQPTTDYLLIPKVSSERRRYIPIGFMEPTTVASDLVFVVPNATLYHFGVLTSQIHMAWTRCVCGRLKSDYRYSKDIVYNNFPWPEPDALLRGKIESAARGVLDARALFPNASLADLYDPNATPPALIAAHAKLDKLVDSAYSKNGFVDDAERVALLFERYVELASARP